MADYDNNTKIEKVGNVTLDYTYYSGEDLYSEGEAEDALLDIVTRYTEADYDKIIQERCSWSVMYHLSYIRKNATKWIPLNGDEKILEVGAGCGAITGDLADRGGSVTCIELSRKRSLINATRHRLMDNINIKVGNFEDIEPNLTEKYDIITLIGVLEYSRAYLSGEHKHHAMLNRLKSHLSPGGRIIIAIENRLGLKYFAGCKEDHTGNYFDGIMGYTLDDDVRTFSKNQLTNLLSECGLNSKFYYPYPDYKLPETIYSDDKLPGIGELDNNIRNFDSDRVVLFDEKRAFDSLIEEGVFPQYSNSFIVIATKNDEYVSFDEVPIYAKYSDQRIEQLRISTSIIKDAEGNKKVYKTALTAAANKHIRKIADSYEVVRKMYSGTRLEPNIGKFIEGHEPAPLIAGLASKARDSVEFEYLKGVTLEDYITELDKNEKYEHIEELIKTYVRLLNSVDGAEPFKPTPEFEKIFGKRNFKKDYMALPVSNFDLIFSNIMLEKDKLEDGPWHVLDYEWVFDFPIPIPFIIYRAIFYQAPYDMTQGFNKYMTQRGRDIYAACGIDIGERMLFAEMEHSFLRHVIGGMASLDVMRVMMPNACIDMDRIVKMGSYLRNLDTPKIYYSRSHVFVPDQRINVLAKVETGKITVRIPVEQYFTFLRIDPTEYPSVMYMDSVKIMMADGNRIEPDSVVVNGYILSGRLCLYDTDDAQIIIENIPKGAKAVEATYAITMYDPAFYNETLKLCREKRAKEIEDKKAFSYRLKRKLKMIQPENLPEGFTRLYLN